MSENCIGLVLAGGRSSRMGENKAYLTRNNQTMLEYATSQLLLAGVSKVVVSGNNSGGLADIVNDGGPLAGVHAVLTTYQPTSLLILPVDMPLMTNEALTMLLQAGIKTNKAQHFTDVSLPAYVPVTAQLSEFLTQAFTSPHFVTSGRGPSLRQLFSLIDAQSLPLANQQCLFNTNTPEQWQQSQKLITF